MKYAVTIDGVTRDVEIQANPDGGYLVALDDEEPRPWSGVKLEPAEWILRSGHASHAVGAYLDKDQVRLQIDGHSVLAKVVDRRSLAASGGSSDADQGQISTTIPGAVVRVLAKAGERVTQGQVLLVVEAMKMENEFKAPFDGVVAQVNVQPGDTVTSGQLLVVIEQD